MSDTCDGCQWRRCVNRKENRGCEEYASEFFNTNEEIEVLEQCLNDPEIKRMLQKGKP